MAAGLQGVCLTFECAVLNLFFRWDLLIRPSRLLAPHVPQLLQAKETYLGSLARAAVATQMTPNDPPGIETPAEDLDQPPAQRMQARYTLLNLFHAAAG